MVWSYEKPKGFMEWVVLSRKYLAMYEVKFDYFQASMSNSNFCN